MLTVVVFPAPFGPRSPKTSPRLISSDSPSTARIDPNVLCRFKIRSMILKHTTERGRVRSNKILEKFGDSHLFPLCAIRQRGVQRGKEVSVPEFSFFVPLFA